MYSDEATNKINEFLNLLYIQFDVDNDATVVDVDGDCEKLIGYKPEEFIGKKAFDLIVKEDADNYINYQHKKGLVNKNFPVSIIPVKYHHKNGSIVKLLMIGGLATNDNRWRTICIPDLFLNIKNIDAYALKQNIEITEYFLERICHDMRNNLHQIFGLINLIKDNEKSKVSDNLSKITSIEKSSNHILELVNNMCNITNIKSRKLKMRNFSMRNLIDNLNSKYFYSMKKNNLVFSIDDKINHDVVNYDYEKLVRILDNLLSNSLKYTPINGNVIFKIHEINSETSETSEPSKNSIYEFSVFNDCDKMSNSTFKSLQINNNNKLNLDSLANRNKGLGLGLSIVHEFLLLMDAKFLLEIEENTNINFRFMLKLNHSDAIIKNMKQKEIYNFRTKDLKMMIVDDDQLNNDIMKKIFEKLEINNVVVCNSSEETINYFKTNNDIDIIFIDLLMPGGKNGIETTEILRKKYNLTCPIIILSGNSDEDIRDSAMRLGASNFLLKPLKIIDLKKTLSIYVPNY